MLILAAGDLYIPDRAVDIPDKFRKLLSPNPASKPTNSKLSKVLCLGNVTSSWSTLQFFNDLSPSFHIVKGEFDDENVLSQQMLRLSDDIEASLTQKNKTLPQVQVVSHDNLKIGFTSGYQIVPRNDPLSLLALARELDVDILIWGGTHKVEAYTLDGKFFVNPGSITGAFSFDWPEEEKEKQTEEQSKKEGGGDEQQEVKETDAQNGGQIDGQQGQNDESTDASATTGRTNLEAEALGTGEPGNDEGNSTVQSEKAHTPETSPQPHASDLVEELSSAVPSFCLLDVRESTCTVYIYTYLNGEVKVDKVSYQKE